jgi:hypothetical protein
MRAVKKLLWELIRVVVCLLGLSHGSCTEGNGERVACPEAVAHRAG